MRSLVLVDRTIRYRHNDVSVRVLRWDGLEYVLLRDVSGYLGLDRITIKKYATLFDLPSIKPNRGLATVARTVGLAPKRGSMSRLIEFHSLVRLAELIELTKYTYYPLTHNELTSVFDYDDNTGLFTWVDSGESAGCLSNGYVIINYRGETHPAHRLAWFYVHGEMPKKYIDHINGVKDDNRIYNLRAATPSQNTTNAGKRITNKSGYKGVSWYKNTGKWRAQIGCNWEVKHLGMFDCKHEAARAYNEAALEMFGDFAVLNDVQEYDKAQGGV